MSDLSKTSKRRTATIDESEWAQRDYRDGDGKYKFPMRAFRDKGLRLKSELGTTILVAANMLDYFACEAERFQRENHALKDRLEKMLSNQYTLTRRRRRVV